MSRRFSDLRKRMSPERQARNAEAAFGPRPYGPPEGFASIGPVETIHEVPPCEYRSRCSGCRAVFSRGRTITSPCPRCGELPHDDEGLEETRAALSERMRAGGLAVPEGSEP